jgi:hypothetical protein
MWGENGGDGFGTGHGKNKLNLWSLCRYGHAVAAEKAQI